MFKNYKACLNSNIVLKIFTRRVINWNHLRDEVVSCKSLSTFKIKLDEFMSAKGEIVVWLMHNLFPLVVLFL